MGAAQSGSHLFLFPVPSLSVFLLSFPLPSPFLFPPLNVLLLLAACPSASEKKFSYYTRAEKIFCKFSNKTAETIVVSV